MDQSSPIVHTAVTINQPDFKKELKHITKNYNKVFNPRFNKVQGVTAQNIPSIQIEFNSNLKIMALLDTGASYNVVNRKLFDTYFE